jgi:predicted GNAT superfamily acetyltransferase
MTEVLIRQAHELDFETIVLINEVEVEHTSPMDLNRLRALNQISAYHRVAEVEGTVGAFLLAMSDGRSYQNENYGWFASRYPRFLYVDRIVVDAKYGGLGIGTKLYRDIFAFARSQSIPVVTCEYNVIPSNEPSRAFHEKFGFEEVGTQWLANGTKKVSMQVAAVSKA